MMQEEIKETISWLGERWRIDNHPKYQRYKEQWISNLTIGQIEGFYKQMINCKENILQNQSGKLAFKR